MFADCSGRTKYIAKGNMNGSVTQLIKALKQMGLGAYSFSEIYMYEQASMVESTQITWSHTSFLHKLTSEAHCNLVMKIFALMIRSRMSLIVPDH